MYRPDGLKNPYSEDWATAYKVYEQGADAMLEGLIKQPSNRGANVLYVDELADSSTIIHEPHRKGYLVFIPEEE